MAGVIISGDTSGAITLQSPAVAGTNTVNFGANTGTAILDANTPAFRNRIINGAMVIDQRNAGASVTPADQQYTLDRWVYVADQASKCTIEQTISGVSAPAGFSDYLGVTSTATTTITTSQVFAVVQRIEGYNMADFAWGTASAATVTLSFWVRSSLTGTFGGSVDNDVDRSYPFSYTISAANTWEQKSVTITGCTDGTWVTTNGIGINLQFALGVGSSRAGTAGAWASGTYFSATGATNVMATNGATFYITGVQLEKGSTATSFDYRPYGTELQLCQRYYEVLYNDSSAAGIFILNFDTSVFRGTWYFKQEKRASATVALGSGSSWGGATPTIYGGISSARFDTTTGAYSVGTANGVSLTASAEL